VSVVLTLLAAEAGLRLWASRAGLSPDELAARLRDSAAVEVPPGTEVTMYGLVRPSPVAEIVYELRPNLDVLFRRQPVRTNRWAMRGPETERRKPPGVFRIAGIGDSHMFGWGVAQGEPFLDQAAALLDRRAGGGRRFEALNFAVPGYNTAMEVATLERRALAFAPDLVVLHFYGNDWNLPHFMQPPRTALARRRPYLVDLTLAAAGVEPPPGELELHDHQLAEVAPEARRELRQRYGWMTGRRGFLRAMDRLAGLSRAHRLPVAVMVLGAANEPYLTARRAAQERGFLLVDAWPAFARHRQESGLAGDRRWRAAYTIPRDGHPNALAHRLYAEVLVAELERAGLVPAPGSPAAGTS
jgi:hypothetical protein